MISSSLKSGRGDTTLSLLIPAWPKPASQRALHGCDWLTGQLIHMDGGNYLGTGGNFYALREWSDAQWLEARARIEAQNEKDRAQRS